MNEDNDSAKLNKPRNFTVSDTTKLQKYNCDFFSPGGQDMNIEPQDRENLYTKHF